jgi:hypothetical protein
MVLSNFDKLVAPDLGFGGPFYETIDGSNVWLVSGGMWKA